MGARGRKSASESATPPPLQLVSPSLPVELPAPPSHLSPEAQDWWRQIVADFELGPHHLKILEAAADSWDRLVTARTELLRDGLTVQGAHGPKTHPAVAVERDSRAAFARLIRELDLDEPTPAPARYVPPPALRIEPEEVTVPVKRRLSKQREGAITPTVLGLFKRALELREQERP